MKTGRPRIEVINTGTEILLGKVINTHLAFFAEELFNLGLRIDEQLTIPDGEGIGDALREAAQRAEIILVTGGLGPTDDDVTREVIARMTGAELRFNAEIYEDIAGFFEKRGFTVTDRVKRQAYVPEGADVLWNDHGTAPGLYVHPEQGPLQGKHVFLMPGPPRELKPMFLDRVLPAISRIVAQNREGQAEVINRTFRLVGLGESHVEDRISAPIEALGPGLELGYCARTGEVDVRLIGAPALVAEAEKIVRAKVKNFIYSDDGADLPETIVRLLTERGQWLATAESCTGGLLANRLTNVSGSSGMFLGGFVTYANAAKVRDLEVSEEILARHGAVSEEVARQMAEGALRRTGADYALATTGIAGPTGGTEEKPVGTVFVTLASKTEMVSAGPEQIDPPSLEPEEVVDNAQTIVNRYRFPTDRETFKYAVSQRAFDMLRRRVSGLPRWKK